MYGHTGSVESRKGFTEFAKNREGPHRPGSEGREFAKNREGPIGLDQKDAQCASHHNGSARAESGVRQRSEQDPGSSPGSRD